MSQSPGDVHMVEVDVVLRGGDGDPVLAHPPDTDSDITLQEWLALMASTNKGIKLDFKRCCEQNLPIGKGDTALTLRCRARLTLPRVRHSLAAVGPSLELLGQVGQRLARPVWLNGDVVPGPRGDRAPLDARAFLRATTACCPDATLSLGWSTGCHRRPGKGRYGWPMVQEMWQLCQPLSQPVTFAVRAALVPDSLPQLQWLLQQCPRYSLTVWTGKEDVYSVEDLLLIRENFDKSRVYYDIFEPQNSEFKKAIGIE
ncbi:Protein FAM151B [Lonchura striata]|uniref:Protein FAM151B n=1 Tax=Lonchura striata TaxID=40157 RepID=A0A218V1Q2_9PASE|nr:Protein FAM151B [Lonchura striata domestica]